MKLTEHPDELHFEPFVHLAGLDDDQVLIAWGGFWFTPFPDGRGWRILDDEELDIVDEGRVESIGARSRPYGEAIVRVYEDGTGKLAAEAKTAEANHVWVRGLTADTAYRYEIVVDGRPWAPEVPMCWHRLDDERGELRPAQERYDLRFRTFPDPGGHDVDQVSFAALGDYGVGIQGHGDHGDHQLAVARTLLRLVDSGRVRLVLTLGDNIYHEAERGVGGSGAEDDDWYFSFYEPYRFVISRVPVYPTVGNHDAAETEQSDDRLQLADNQFTDIRFRPEVGAGRDSVTTEDDEAPGMFYRFSYGRLLELCCLDTSEASTLDAERYFEDEGHHAFLDDTFAADRSGRPLWLIPFMHHPPYCAGPKHGNDAALIRSMVPRFAHAGVRLVLAGHEHNFQHSVADGIDYVVSGAGGKLRPEPPQDVVEAHTVGWSNQPHLLVIDATTEHLTVWPVRDVRRDGTLVCVDARTPAGAAAPLPILVNRPTT